MPWLRLPDETTLQIFRCLSDRDLISAGQTCGKWHSLSQDQSLWKRLISVHYPPQQSLPCGSSAVSSVMSSLDLYRTFKDDVPSVNVQEAKKHSDEVLHVSFSHNGQLVCSTSKDATACLWSVTPDYRLDLIETLMFNVDQAVPFRYTLYSEFNQDDSLLLVCGSINHPQIRGMVYVYDIKQQKFIFRAVNRPYDVYSTWLGTRHFIYGDIVGANPILGGSESVLYCSDVRAKTGNFKVLCRFDNGQGAYVRQMKSMPSVDKTGKHSAGIETELNDHRVFYSKGGSYFCGHQVACCNVTTDTMPQCSHQKEFITSAHSAVQEVAGRVIGLQLSPDNQYIYINCRRFLDIDNQVGWRGPDISEDVEVRAYRTDSLELVQILHGHKCFTPKTGCFFIFLDVSDRYVARSDELNSTSTLIQ